MTEINKRMKLHFEKAKEYESKGWRILGVFLYGSQNYGLSTETSDVDTKAILVPDFENLILQNRVSEELHLENREHCEVKDIHSMVKMFKKQNVNFVETLFTDCFCISNRFYSEWGDYFLDNREKIVRLNIKKTVTSISGQAINSLQRKPTNGKYVATGYRMKYFLERFLDGGAYRDCLQPQGQIRELCLKLKTGEVEPCQTEVDELIDFFRKQKTEIEKKDYPDNSSYLDELLIDFFNRLIYKRGIYYADF